MQMRNAMELVVATNLDEVLAEANKYGLENICTCARCRLDIMALTLNALPPRYVVCDKGEAYARTAALNQQFKVDILFALLAAIQKVREKPNHDVESA